MSKLDTSEILQKNNSKLINRMSLVMVIFIIGLYYNTVYNMFSFDDSFISVENEIQAQGLAAIPDIFTTPYTSLKGGSVGYRPISRLSFALEYQFTAKSIYNPAISHIINLLLYIIAVLLAFSIMRRLFRNFSLWFLFVAFLIYIAHPLHTEVVASLKNRDVLLNFIFSFLAIKMFLKWADFDKLKYLIFGGLFFLLALLSKETAIAQLAVFPLILYFFTDMPLKKIMWFAGGLVLVIILALGIPALFLPPYTRHYRFFENPLAFEDNFFTIVATGFYGLGHYLKMLVFPYPLRYYYGYNMIPVVNFLNIWALLSFVAHAAMAVYAIMNIRKKTFLSFIFLLYLINVAMYANIVMPVPGIVADRFTFFSSLPFTFFFTWLLFKVLKLDVKKPVFKYVPTLILSIVMLIILSGFSYYVHVRNTNWRSEYRIYNSDMPVLWNSAKANQMFAQQQLELVNLNLAKKVNIYEFIPKMISLAEKHFNRAVEVDSNMYTSWAGLGTIYSRIHGNQAKIRALSYGKKKEYEKAQKERDNMRKYFNKAHYYFKKALEVKPDFDEAIFNIGYTYELEGVYDSAIAYYKKGIEMQGERPNTLSKLSNAYFLNQDFEDAKKTNHRIIELNPETPIPYVNMGNYYMRFNDTVAAIQNYEIAAEKGAQIEVYKFLAHYYKTKKNPKKYKFYFDKAKQMELEQKKEK